MSNLDDFCGGAKGKRMRDLNYQFNTGKVKLTALERVELDILHLELYMTPWVWAIDATCVGEFPSKLEAVKTYYEEMQKDPKDQDEFFDQVVIMSQAEFILYF